MSFKVVKIIGLDYSGTTLCDLLVSSLNDGYVSLGEIERSVGQENFDKQYVCACGADDCFYWNERNLEYPEFLRKTIRRTSIVDSSKTRSSLDSYLNADSKIIFIYKSCLSWCISCLSRYFVIEVKPWKSSNPWKYLVPFIRIEVLRRFIVFLPFEWLFRNIFLLQYSRRSAAAVGCNFSCISLESLTAIYNGYVIQTSRNHILRGNKISRKSGITVKSSPRKRDPLFINFLFNKIFSFFVGFNLNSLTL